jgi:hypothetical protein
VVLVFAARDPLNISAKEAKQQQSPFQQLVGQLNKKTQAALGEVDKAIAERVPQQVAV